MRNPLPHALRAVRVSTSASRIAVMYLRYQHTILQRVDGEEADPTRPRAAQKRVVWLQKTGQCCPENCYASYQGAHMRAPATLVFTHEGMLLLCNSSMQCHLGPYPRARESNLKYAIYTSGVACRGQYLYLVFTLERLC